MAISVVQGAEGAPARRPALPARQLWPRHQGVRAVVGGSDVVGALAVGLVLGLPALLAAGWVLAWVLLVATARPVFGRAGDLVRAAALGGLGWWVLDAFVPLPVTARQLVLVVAASLAVSTLVRLGVGRAREPVRVVLVTADSADSGDAADSADGPEVFDPDRLPTSVAALGRHHLRVVGRCSPDDAVRVALATSPDAVLVSRETPPDGSTIRRLGWGLETIGTPLLVATRLHDVAPHRMTPIRLGSLGLVHIAHPPAAGPARAVKRVLERSAAALALLVLALPLLLLVLVIRVDSPGPALFRQQRIGRFGRRFTMLKLRTMAVDAEARRDTLVAPTQVLFKLAEDPRVTRVGRVLRRYSLDELPQLVNVLRGEMSLVGPRPALPAEVEEYHPDALRRLAIAPGVTGLWQVSGRSDLSWEDSIRLDLDYVDNWSLAGDLTILARTVRAVLGARGAY